MAENEVKFVIRNYAALEALLTLFGWQDIEQGYLTPNNRIRRITSPNGDRTHLFGFKQRLPNGHNLEIEPPIEEAVYTEAWDYTIERVSKRRVRMMHDGLQWDVDFYRWSKPYFVLAEVEMPSTMQRPSVILPYLEPHLVYVVPREDGRFAARRLADEAHVRNMAQELGLDY